MDVHDDELDPVQYMNSDGKLPEDGADIETEYDSWDMLERMWKENQAASFQHEVMMKCLQFCFLFPKNYEFHKDDIIQLWMAQGFFPLPPNEETSRGLTEDTARLHFEQFELLHIFRLSQLDYSSPQPRYRLNHSIFHLLQEQPHDEYARIGNAKSNISENTLHCSLPESSISPTTLENLYRAKRLLTLFIHHDHGSRIIHQVPRQLFLKLPFLRVLDLSHTNISVLPNSIGNLKDLRYLNLSGTPITVLPDSLCSLLQMQTLKLRTCLKLVSLPHDIRKLTNLRHIDIDLACLLVSMPPGLGDLTKLQSLPGFAVGWEKGCQISELQHMVNLGGTLRVLRLENMSSSDEAKKAALDEKKYIQKLELQWSELLDGYAVLEKLKPHTEVRELQIVGYGGANFPSWIGDPLFFRLRTITIHDSRKCVLLPSLGKLPFLYDLCITEIHEVEVIDYQFCGRSMDPSGLDAKKFEAFPSLENLTLNGFPKLQKWSGIEEGDFPCLQKLNISGCSKLTALTQLPLCKSLQRIEISDCPLLESLPDGLPTTLQHLAIVDCPLIKEWHKAGKAEMLVHIPSVSIDYQQIFQQGPPTSGQTPNMETGSPSSDILTRDFRQHPASTEASQFEEPIREEDTEEQLPVISEGNESQSSDKHKDWSNKAKTDVEFGGTALIGRPVDQISDPWLRPSSEEIVSSSLHPVGRQFHYLFHFKENITELRNKLEDLAALKDDVQVKIEVARARGDVIHRVAVRWIKKVEDIQTEVTLLNEKSQKINSWFKGWLYARYSLGKKVVKKTCMVADLLKDGRNMDQISDPWLGPASLGEQVSIEGFEVFASTKSAVDQVMDALNNDEVNVVGVHGMGGIGKTTLMKHVSNLVKAQKLFHVVVMVTVSQNAILRKVQDEIASDLRLELKPAASDKLRAVHLLQRLTDKARVLIILDDLWNRLELEKVGIPTKHPDCKVVITTRRLEVCSVMKTEANVAVDFLSDSDSWLLFKKNAGRVVDDSAGLNKVARDVTQECKGLPIALVTLGRAMRGNYEKDVWQNVLQQLRESDFTDIEDMDASVFKPIKQSYDSLPSDEYRLCFLFCCLFPEDYKINIDELLKYVMGEGLLIDVTNWNQGFSRLRYRIIPKLTSSCLLLKAGAANGSVMMHDIVRDVAIIIAKKEHGFFVRAGFALERLEDNNKLLFECKRLSLMGSKITKLPMQPKFPNILTLSFSRCQSLHEIPDNFFQKMTSLLTLDLSYTSISSLPKSLPCLILLRSLSLDGCSKLRDVSLIGKLKTLEIISLRQTSTHLIPEQEIQEFTNLKHLSVERE